MYNGKIPKDVDLPSSQQLLKSTVSAMIVALALLITVILPAEYGVDPTGVGRMMGLAQMGEIKQKLEAEAELAEQQASDILNETIIKSSAPSLSAMPDGLKTSEQANITPSETMSVLLEPGDAAEIKVGLNKGEVVIYSWSVNSGHVNYDTHGDNAEVNYFGYSKGKAKTQDSGELQAAFDGKHGWFWRNRSSESVTVTLNVSGNFSSIDRVL
jgi:hypothetical protein